MKRALILGSRGGFGGAMAEALWNTGWELQAYSRGTDMAAAAKGVDLIVNGLNPPKYNDWARQIPEITTQVLDAGRRSGAAILLPGNVYPFGAQPGPWGLATPHRPCSRKGRIRSDMEARYRAAADGPREQQVILLRAGDFLSVDAPMTLMGQVVMKDLPRGQIMAMGTPDVPRAWAWLPDLARAGARLAAMADRLPTWTEVPFAGHTFSFADLADEITRQTLRPVRITRFPWWSLYLAAPFWELGREVLEMRYLFETPHRIENGLARWLPDFTGTPFDQVVAAHLARFGSRQVKVNPDRVMV